MAEAVNRRGISTRALCVRVAAAEEAEEAMIIGAGTNVPELSQNWREIPVEREANRA